MMESTLAYEHFAVGDVDYNKLSEQFIDQKCDELFSMRPIPFYPKKGEYYKV